jgi:sensor histidine kinase YesM
MEIQQEANDAMVPNLLLQPIVENAVRYGVSTQSRTGTVTVSARCTDRRLELCVSDDGPGLQEHHEEGIGIGNTKARLRQLYGTNQSFLMTEGPSGGVCVTIQIPLRNEMNEPSAVDQGHQSENTDAHR